MKIRWLMLVTLLLAVPASALAVSFEVRPGIEISFVAPPAPWQVSQEPPEFLVKEHSAHINPNQLAAAQKAGIDSPEGAARQMLKANELFIFNPQSGAHLEVDFSPLREGESPPSAGALKNSARYAAEGLEDEKGIEAASSRVGKTKVNGVNAAYRIDAEFLKHGIATQFIGVIGFAQNHWVYLYFTGPQSGADDLAAVNQVLDSFSIVQERK